MPGSAVARVRRVADWGNGTLLAPSRPRVWPNRLFLFLMAGCLLLPLCLKGWGRPRLGWPRVFSGDEPHYLVIIHSLLSDGDLDLRNNYASVHQGSFQAGRRWQELQTLDHHSCFMVDGQQVFWQEVYSTGRWKAVEQWQRDRDGHPFVLPSNPTYQIPVDAPEYPIHQPSLAFMLAPFLFPLRGTDYVEPAVLLCSGLAVVAGMLFYRLLLGTVTSNPLAINVATFLTFLGTPIWFYGRSLFMESFLLCFAVGAYALALRKEQGFLPGLLFGLGLQLKPYFALLALPLLIDCALRRRFRQAILLLVPMALSVGLLLALYRSLYGSCWTPPQPFVWGSLSEGLIGQFCSPRFGLLFIAPATVIALVCWPHFLTAAPRVALLCAGGFLMQYVVTSAWDGWDGRVFGPRHLVPVLPFLFIALAFLPRLPLTRLETGRCALSALGLASIGINFLAVSCYCRYWLRHPLVDLFLHGNAEFLPTFVTKWYAS